MSVCPLLYLDIAKAHLFTTPLPHHSMPCLCPQSSPSSQTLIPAFRCIKAAVLSQGQMSPCLCCAGRAGCATIGTNALLCLDGCPRKVAKRRNGCHKHVIYMSMYVLRQIVFKPDSKNVVAELFLWATHPAWCALVYLLGQRSHVLCQKGMQMVPNSLPKII